MDFRASPYVRTLSATENEFLQVLLTEFTLKRKSPGKGAVLTVKFDDATPTIAVRRAKDDVKARIPDFANNAKRLQKKLDDFLVKGKGELWQVNEPRFPFRYGSGGALPVLHLVEEKDNKTVEKEYYCMFLRDIDPIGWNIANGGTDTHGELINPLEALERELREELLIVDLDRKFRYAFADDVSKPLDHPDFANARQIWKKYFPHDFPNFKEVEIPLKWEEGPDTLNIQVNDEEKPREVSGCFLNINALDFGIEIDRIAHLNIGKTASLCDGEIKDHYPLNRIVGLFEVDKTNQKMEGDAEETRFLPDKFFFSAERSGKPFHDVVEEFKEHIKFIRSDSQLKAFAKEAEHPEGFKLCPVSWRIIKRYAMLRQDTAVQRGRVSKKLKANAPFEVFISFASEDEDLARAVYEFVRHEMNKTVFFSPESRHYDIIGPIVSALDRANCLIVVLSDPEHLGEGDRAKGWLDFECKTFLTQKIVQHKHKKIFSVIRGFKSKDLPPLVRSYKAVEVQSQGRLEARHKRELRKLLED